jgi:autoinducer 2 (AI-2) kinase
VAADHLLALDAGTSGARCVILAPDGATAAAVREPWSYFVPHGTEPLGRAFDALAFWATLVALAKRALAQAGLSGVDIAGVGVTAQRLAFLVIDREGTVLYAGPNSDARAVREGIMIDVQRAERVYRSCGKLPSLILGPARLQWLRENEPDEFARAAAVLTLGDWIAYKLTGELRAERTLAADTGLLDVSTGERDAALFEELGLPIALFPPLVSPADVAGAVTKAAARETGLAPGTPVVIAGGDTQCALLGMGIEEPGETGIAAGWSCPLQIVTPAPRFDGQRRTWVCPHAVPGRWLVESSTHDAGRIWRWWCEQLLGEREGALEEGAELASQAPAGAGDVAALLGPRVMNAGAMGLHLGGVLMRTPLFAESIGKPELLRAVLENIAYALRANLEQAEEVAGHHSKRVTIGGGLTLAPVFPRILADVLGRKIEVAQDVETSARGAARLVARALGRADGAYTIPTQHIEPDAGAALAYGQRYLRWSQLGDRLDDIMKELP